MATTCTRCALTSGPSKSATRFNRSPASTAGLCGRQRRKQVSHNTESWWLASWRLARPHRLIQQHTPGLGAANLHGTRGEFDLSTWRNSFTRTLLLLCGATSVTGTETPAPVLRARCAGGASQGAGDYLNLAQHSHQYNSGTSLQELYGDTAVWIQHHQGGYGGRGGTARMWRSGFGSGAGRRR